MPRVLTETERAEFLAQPQVGTLSVAAEISLLILIVAVALAAERRAAVDTVDA